MNNIHNDLQPVYPETTAKKFVSFDSVFVRSSGKCTAFREYISYVADGENFDPVRWFSDGGRTPVSAAVPYTANLSTPNHPSLMELVYFPRGDVDDGYFSVLQATFDHGTLRPVCTVSFWPKYDAATTVKVTLDKLSKWCKANDWHLVMDARTSELTPVPLG